MVTHLLLVNDSTQMQKLCSQIPGELLENPYRLFPYRFDEMRAEIRKEILDQVGPINHPDWFIDLQPEVPAIFKSGLIPVWSWPSGHSLMAYSDHDDGGLLFAIGDQFSKWRTIIVLEECKELAQQLGMEYIHCLSSLRHHVTIRNQEMRIRMKITPEGKTEIDVLEGFRGKSCMDLVDRFCNRIGASGFDDQVKPEILEEAVEEKTHE